MSYNVLLGKRSTNPLRLLLIIQMKSDWSLPLALTNTIFYNLIIYFFKLYIKLYDFYLGALI